MVEYAPVPENLHELNPIQRYMQKGSLDRQDYAYLFIFVLAYFAARPYIQKLAKWFFAPKELLEGEAAQKEYFDSKAKVSPNEIRGEKEEQPNSISETKTAASGSNTDKKGNVVNRKSKAQVASQKTQEEQLLNWDDEPARKATEGDKSDIVAWLDRWDKEEN